jgi:hypothetical protein
VGNFGLTSSDLEDVKAKLLKQRAYLESETFVTSSGQVKSLLDVSFSANHSERYFARVLNKVNTFVSYNIDKGRVPVFLTITLDGNFRDFLKGDYRRVDKLDRSSVPDNFRNGFILSKIDNREVLTVKDLYSIVNHQYHRFQMSHGIKQLKGDYSYIRVAEPHKKDGVPHFHILMYLLPSKIAQVKKEFEKFFPAPRNHKKLNKCDTHGFQTEIRSAVGYILKYILKSFRNVIEDKEPDYIDAWYVHNRIPRVIFSHTLLSQELYTKIAILDDDWYYLSQLSLFKDVVRSFAFLEDNGRRIIVENNHVMIYNQGILVREYGSYKYLPMMIYPKKMKFTIKRPLFYNPLREYRLFKSKFYKPEKNNALNISVEYASYEVELKYKSVKYIKGQSLLEFFYNFDPDIHNPAKYGVIKKELIRRGLLDYEDINLNDYNSRFDFDDF